MTEPACRETTAVRLKVLIVGSGFGGLCAALMLRRLGIEEFRILERRPFMGGTWCQNTYPGAAVDVQSPLYSIASEPYDWSQMFARQAELRAYTHHIIRKYSLERKTDVSTTVGHIEWNESHAHWRIHTTNGRKYEAQFVINASGPLSTPHIPHFPGIERFQRPMFHTNQWDHRMDLSGMRVAIVGSGASAAQVIPAIAPEVSALHVFQRTPHWVMPRADHTFTTLQRRILRTRWGYKMLRTAIYWGLETRVIGFKYSHRALRALAQRKALEHLHAQVPDLVLRQKLTPDYLIGCKRIVLSNTLYPALCRSNVSLHDRDDGIAMLTTDGIQTAQGSDISLDAIIWATGFRATDDTVSYPIVGRDGLALQEAWTPYPRAYLGTTIPGFPNLFIVTGPNTGIGHTSAIFVIESQMKYIARCIQETERQGMRAVEVKQAAEQTYTDAIHKAMQGTVWKVGGCDSWYRSQSGHVIAMYPGFSFSFRRAASRLKPTDHRFS